MATSPCFIHINSFIATQKPGFHIVNSINPKPLRRTVKFHSVKAKAAEGDQGTKPNSVICADCDGNGAVICSQCKGSGVNPVDYFGGQFKAGESCWLCGCSFCQKLAPEYEKAASVLSSHDPPVTLAKVDVSEEKNMDLAREFKISSFPTIKIFRMGENHIQDYQGPTRDAEGIVAYLKKQIGSSSAAEIEESAEDYQGPRDADGIVPYLKKKLIGSASAKIEESTEDFDLDMYINVI